MWCAFQSVNNRGREMKTKMKKFPKTPFKLDCGDKPEVRQWLEDNECVFPGNGDATCYRLDEKYLCINEGLVFVNTKEFFDKNLIPTFNPFKKKSKLEERVEALEEQIKSPGLLMKITEDLSSLPTFMLKAVAIKEEPKIVNVGRYKPEKYEKYYYNSVVNNQCYCNNNLFELDKANISTGNCYRTSQEAEQALLRQQALVRVNDRIDELNDGWIPETFEEKHLISLDADDGKIKGTTYRSVYFAQIFKALKDYSSVSKLVSEMEEDIKLAAGWEK